MHLNAFILHICRSYRDIPFFCLFVVKSNRKYPVGSYHCSLCESVRFWLRQSPVQVKTSGFDVTWLNTKGFFLVFQLNFNLLCSIPGIKYCMWSWMNAGQKSQPICCFTSFVTKNSGWLSHVPEKKILHGNEFGQN